MGYWKDLESKLFNKRGQFNESYVGDEDDWSDEELANIYGGDLTYCKDCGRRLSFGDGYSFCPNCNPEEGDVATNEWTFVDSKTVEDSDGFTTDYSWYRNSSGHHVMIFGDTELYSPEDTEPDAEFDSEDRAKEWFDTYEGFAEDDDFSIYESTDSQQEKPNRIDLYEIVTSQGGKTEVEHHVFNSIDEARNYVKDALLSEEDIERVDGCDIKQLFEANECFTEGCTFEEECASLEDRKPRGLRGRVNKFESILNENESEIDPALIDVDKVSMEDWSEYGDETFRRGYALVYDQRERVIAEIKTIYYTDIRQPGGYRITVTTDYKELNRLLSVNNGARLDVVSSSTSEYDMCYDVYEDFKDRLRAWQKNHSTTINESNDRYFTNIDNSDINKKFDTIKKDAELSEEWSHFTYTSGANPYIAKTEDEKRRVLNRWREHARFVGNIEGIDYYTIDDATDSQFAPIDLDESIEEDKPFKKSQIFDELKRETKNWTIEKDEIYYGFESEFDYAMSILEKHYEEVIGNPINVHKFSIKFSSPKKKRDLPKEILNETSDGKDELWNCINNYESSYRRLADIVKNGVERNLSKSAIISKVRREIYSMKDDFGRIYTTSAERAELARDFVEDELPNGYQGG